MIINTTEQKYQIDCKGYNHKQMMLLLEYFDNLGVKWASGEVASDIPTLNGRRYLIVSYGDLHYSRYYQENMTLVIPAFRLNKLKRILDK